MSSQTAASAAAASKAPAATEPEKTALLSAVRTSFEKGSFIRIALGKYRGPAPELRCSVTRVMLKDVPHLRFVTRRGTQDHTENAVLDAALARLDGLIGTTYLSATVFTTEQDVALVYSKKRVGRLTRSKPALPELPPTGHDRTKSYLVDPNATFLAELGVTHRPAAGKPAEVKPSMYAKYRQINRFVEILDQLIGSSELAAAPAPRIVDIGAGKGYLTFALHEHLARRQGRAPVTIGIESNAVLVGQCNAVATRCGIAGLTFEAVAADSRPPEGVDVLIALHACDTATDDAIHYGIASGAALIVCAPCCQHEIAPQMRVAGSPLEGLLKFGLLRQRQADLVTDAVRALSLEAHGYEVRIIEFVSTEHTAKNLLIAAVRSASVDRQSASAQLERLTDLVGFSRQRLMTALGALGA